MLSQDCRQSPCLRIQRRFQSLPALGRGEDLGPAVLNQHHGLAARNCAGTAGHVRPAAGLTPGQVIRVCQHGGVRGGPVWGRMPQFQAGAVREQRGGKLGIGPIQDIVRVRDAGRR